MKPAGRFALLFAAQFAAIGVMMPFYPAVLRSHGLDAAEVSTVLAAGSATRLLAAPVVGSRADGWSSPQRVLVLAALLGALSAFGFIVAGSLVPLLLAAVLHGLCMAPVVPLGDALCLGAARRHGFDYGRSRSAGSASYILGAILAGQAVALWGVRAAIPLFALLLALSAVAAARLPAEPAATGGRAGGFGAPFRDAGFRWLLPLSALIQGSHALYYAFSTIHWQAAGLSPAVIGLLWAEGVVAEVALFLWGRGIAERLGPAGLAALAAGAGLLRWGVTGATTALVPLALAQALHGITFGAQHLAAMRVLAALPAGQAATAQSLHGSLGVGLASGVLTFLCGPLYAAFGGRGFWAMAALCALALPLTLGLRTALRRPVRG